MIIKNLEFIIGFEYVSWENGFQPKKYVYRCPENPVLSYLSYKTNTHDIDPKDSDEESSLVCI